MVPSVATLRAALVGRDDRVAARWLLVAAALALAAVVARPVLPLDDVARPAAPTVGEVERTAIPAVALLAAVAAYRTEGLLPPTAVLFGPAAGWFGVYEVAIDYVPPGRLWFVVLQGLAFGGLFAWILGPWAFVAGAGARGWPDGNARDDASGDPSDGDPPERAARDLLARLLVGQDEQTSMRWALGGGALFVPVLVGGVFVGEPGSVIPGGEWPVYPAVLLLAAVHAYLNDGLVVSWTVVLGPVAGLQVASAVTPTYPTFGPPGFVFLLVYQSWFVLAVAGGLGTAGFLLGVGTRGLLGGLERRVRGVRAATA